MTQLHKVGARLSAIGRCALVGMLVGMLATQAVAEGATAVSLQTPAKPETTSVPSGFPEQISLATTANLPLAPQDNFDADLNAMPDAPTAQTGTSDSSSLSLPPELKAMMADAAQNAQNVQSSPALVQPKHPIHGGWLVLAGVGALWMGIGIWGLSVKGSEKGPITGIFVVPGAAMLGGGLYLTFRK